MKHMLIIRLRHDTQPALFIPDSMYTNPATHTAQSSRVQYKAVASYNHPMPSCPPISLAPNHLNINQQPGSTEHYNHHQGKEEEKKKMVCSKCQKKLKSTELATPGVKRKSEMYYGSPATSSGAGAGASKPTLGNTGIGKVIT